MELIGVYLDNEKVISFRKELLLKDPRADHFILSFMEFLYQQRTKSVQVAIVMFLDNIGYNWLTYLVLEPELSTKMIQETSLVIRLETRQKKMEVDLLSMEKLCDKDDKVHTLLDWGEKFYVFLRE
jgi:hypothetical protein